jgi:hypothetical protein
MPKKCLKTKSLSLTPKFQLLRKACTKATCHKIWEEMPKTEGLAYLPTFSPVSLPQTKTRAAHSLRHWFK